jgi:Ran GTPase-activating protein (RanGAP) involved in mRNA processing and transport
MSTIQTLFGELRSIMNMHELAHDDRMRCLEIIAQAANLDKDAYEATLIPYLSTFHAHFDTSFFTLTSTRQLASVPPHSPFIWYDLELIEHTLTRNALTALLATSALERVRSLTLFRNGLRADEMVRLMESPHLKNLKALHLMENKVGRRGGEALFDSDMVTQLESLSLNGARVKGVGMRGLIRRSEEFGVLRDLDLHDNNLGDGTMRDILRATSHLAWRRLGLGKNHVGNHTALTLSFELNLDELERLNLSGSALSPEDFLALIERPRFPVLRELHLNSCGLQDESIEQLLRRPWLHGLGALHLERNRLTRTSAMAIAQCDALSGLHTLSLNSNRGMDREGFRALYNSAHLAPQIRDTFKRRAGIR